MCVSQICVVVLFGRHGYDNYAACVFCFLFFFAKFTRHHDPRIDSELKCHCLRYLGHRVNMFHDHIEVHYWLHKLTFIE